MSEMERKVKYEPQNFKFITKSLLLCLDGFYFCRWLMFLFLRKTSPIVFKMLIHDELTVTLSHSEENWNHQKVLRQQFSRWQSRAYITKSHVGEASKGVCGAFRGSRYDSLMCHPQKEEGKKAHFNSHTLL